MAKDSKDLQLIELKDTIKELNTTVKNLNALLEAASKREEDHIKREQVLQEQIDYLTRKLFGKSSEKRNGDVEGQQNLFNEAEVEQTAPDPSEEEFITIEKHTRKKKSSNAEKFGHLPVEEVLLDVDEDKRVCEKCGTALEYIGKEFVRQEVEIIKPSAKIIKYYSATYGCPQCKKDAEIPYIVKGKDGKPHMIHGMASASTVAWVMYQKYVNGLPLYRQEQDFKRLFGIDISRGTIANWIIKNAEQFFVPLYDYFQRRLIAGRYAMADETPVQVLKEPGRRPQTKSFMWVFRTGEFDKEQIVLFHYSPTRAGDTAKEFLEGFTGYLMTDGYSGYNKLKNCTRTSCWAYVRRYLIDAIPKGKEYDYAQPAVQGLAYVNKLFNMERFIHIASRRRNPYLADIFHRLQLMERSGSGIKEIMNDYKASANITEDRLPTFFSDESDFNVTFWNLNYGVEQISSGESNGESSGEVTEKSDVIINLNNTEKQIIKLIAKNSAITQKEIAIQIGLSEGGIRKPMTKLKNAGIIMREGSTKNGNWKVVEDK